MPNRYILALPFLIGGPAVWAADLLEPYSDRSVEVIAPDRRTEHVIQLQPGASEILKVARKASVVIVGSSAVVEATLLGSDAILLNAKATGSTNLIILDASGVAILRAGVRVGPRETEVLVFSGDRVTEYVCAPSCKPGAKSGNTSQREPPPVTEATTEVVHRNADGAVSGTTSQTTTSTTRP